ncbi:putative glycolipid-binding domain-containing protein [Actinomadura sp. WMMA1423]|uniref:putative glycolipid-binding domain-containing protein n=1 Tax=Actinomadura sp. WMMA1423 TaxID=2591108 RepID=UPI00114638FA|nr:putative glycolipid-binding domain-containing protein [Actinomadura sp. WMMA1423]
MALSEPPVTAAWQHRGARAGFEVLEIARSGAGWRLHGTTAAVEDGVPWTVDYVIEVDERWHTRGARVAHLLGGGPGEVTVQRTGEGRWTVDDRYVPELDGCLDVDLESSAMTNALPVHRLGLPVGRTADVPAVYVRAADLTVDRLEQTYTRAGDTAYDYAAPAFDFTARLLYDDSGFVLEYPGLATRHA